MFPRTTFPAVLLGGALGLMLLAGPAGCKAEHDHAALPASESTPAAAPATQPAPAMTYTCPMHAEVSQTTPGKCAKCGMALVKK